MIGDFKATYCGAEYHNIDGTGWPDAVVMENQGSVLDGTYESRMYYPERTCTMDRENHCSICRENTPNTLYWVNLGGGFRTVKSRKPLFCGHCGARVVS